MQSVPEMGFAKWITILLFQARRFVCVILASQEASAAVDLAFICARDAQWPSNAPSLIQFILPGSVVLTGCSFASEYVLKCVRWFPFGLFSFYISNVSAPEIFVKIFLINPEFVIWNLFRKRISAKQRNPAACRLV